MDPWAVVSHWWHNVVNEVWRHWGPRCEEHGPPTTVTCSKGGRNCVNLRIKLAGFTPVLHLISEAFTITTLSCSDPTDINIVKQLFYLLYCVKARHKQLPVAILLLLNWRAGLCRGSLPWDKHMEQNRLHDGIHKISHETNCLPVPLRLINVNVAPAFETTGGIGSKATKWIRIVNKDIFFIGWIYFFLIKKWVVKIISFKFYQTRVCLESKQQHRGDIFFH